MAELTFVIQHNIEHEFFVDILNKYLNKDHQIKKMYDQDFRKYRNDIVIKKLDLEPLGNVIIINSYADYADDTNLLSTKYVTTISQYVYKSVIKDSLSTPNESNQIDSLLATTRNTNVLAYIQMYVGQDDSVADKQRSLSELHVSLKGFQALVSGSYINSKTLLALQSLYLFDCKTNNMIPLPDYAGLSTGSISSTFVDEINKPMDTNKMFEFAKYRLKNSHDESFYDFNFKGVDYHIFMMAYNNNPLEVTALVPDSVDAKVIINFNGFDTVFNIYTPTSKRAKEIALAFVGDNKARIYGNDRVATVKINFRAFDMIKEGLKVNTYTEKKG